jgi:hypothetical protein
MIAEGALEGLFYIPEDVSPQHVTTEEAVKVGFFYLLSMFVYCAG